MSSKKSDSPEKALAPKKGRRPQFIEGETVFLGAKISKEIHQRLYRAKAHLEFTTGEFYGMGRLLDRVLKIGLKKIEQSFEEAKPISK